MSQERIDRLLKPDGQNLTAVVWGRAGSGKSFAVEHWSRIAIKSRAYGQEWRLIYVSPKHEGFEGLSIGKKKVVPMYDVESVVDNVRKNRVSVWYPENVSQMNIDLDFLIGSLYEYQEQNPEFSATLILDDAQTWLEVRKSNSIEMKRLILTGRSKRIKTVLVAHSIVINKMLEGQVDLIIGFDTGNPIYWRSAIERFNLDIEPYAEAIKEKKYSFLWFDVNEQNPVLMNPLDVN
jgi:hypothetical protein